MDSKNLVRTSLAGLPAPRAAAGPLAVHYCAGLAGVSVRDYTLNPRCLADAVIRYYERFRPDAVWVSADTWVTAEAMGAAVAFPGSGQPLAGAGEPLVRTAADIDRIPPPDPTSQGRWPLMLDALRYVKQAIGNETFVVACFDQYPFSLACALMGIQRAMTATVDEPAFLDALMARCSEYAIAYATALAEAGADMLSGGDSPAGLVGPRFYRSLALPYEQRVIGRLKSRLTVPISLHICGDTTPILADMARSGADVLELDHRVDVSNACRTVGPEIAVWGNLDPVGLLVQAGPEEVRRATSNLLRSVAASGHRRWIVSSGCTLAPDTPAENLDALFQAVRAAEWSAGSA